MFIDAPVSIIIPRTTSGSLSTRPTKPENLRCERGTHSELLLRTYFHNRYKRNAVTITLMFPKSPIGRKTSATFAASRKIAEFTESVSDFDCGWLRLRLRGLNSPRLARGLTLRPKWPSLVDEVPVQGVGRCSGSGGSRLSARNRSSARGPVPAQ